MDCEKEVMDTSNGQPQINVALSQEYIEQILRPLINILNEKKVEEEDIPNELVNNQDFVELMNTISMIRESIQALSKGDLAHQVEGKGYTIGFIKNLQSILNHIAVQTRSMARGDFDISIDYLGDFSKSFEYMNKSLRKLMDELSKEKQKATDALQQLDTLFNSTKNLEVIFSFPACLIININRSFLDVTGYTAEQLIGSEMKDLVFFENSLMIREEVFKVCQEADPEKASAEMEITYFQKNKERRYGLLFIKKVILSGKDCVLMDIRDISDRKALEKEIIKISITDKLTQLNNRSGIDEKLKQMMEIACITQKPFTMLMIDIDFFKKVNDRYGHLTGDIILQQLAQILGDQIWGRDLVGRWGGEEFMVVLHGTYLDIGTIVAEKLRKTISESNFEKIGKLTVSIGVTEYILGEEIFHTIERVDKALYMAKENGRNQVQTL